VVLLNNDTTPHPGWLDALVGCAVEHPAAAAVGARLLHLDGTVQHAGVVIGRDRLPHHAYAGFPATTRRCCAAGRSRSSPAPAAAAPQRLPGGRRLRPALPQRPRGRRPVPAAARGGHEVRYCGDAVLTHLESVSRGRTGPDQVANGRLWCQTWQDRVRPTTSSCTPPTAC
jgi:hypothetical protein